MGVRVFPRYCSAINRSSITSSRPDSSFTLSGDRAFCPEGCTFSLEAAASGTAGDRALAFGAVLGLAGAALAPPVREHSRSSFKLPRPSKVTSRTPVFFQYFNARSTSFSVQLKISAIDDSSRAVPDTEALRRSQRYILTNSPLACGI